MGQELPGIIIHGDITELIASGIRWEQLQISFNMLLANTPLINDANLVAYHKFDGNGNDSKNSYNFTESGTITYTNGLYKQAADNGISGANSLYIASDLIGTNAFSVVGNIKMNSQITSGAQAIFFIGKNPANSFHCYTNYEYNGGTPRLNITRGKPSVSVDTTYGTTTLPLNYFHFAYVWDLTSVFVHINGSAIGTLSSSGYGSGGFSDTYNIMVDAAGTNFFYGRYDDWAVFNRALSVAQIGTLAIKPGNGVLGGEI